MKQFLLLMVSPILLAACQSRLDCTSPPVPVYFVYQNQTGENLFNAATPTHYDTSGVTIKTSASASKKMHVYASEDSVYFLDTQLQENWAANDNIYIITLPDGDTDTLSIYWKKIDKKCGTYSISSISYNNTPLFRTQISKSNGLDAYGYVIVK